ncbi:hypothetical protein KKA47_02705 [bacterium]|nr:hypothetical protein [bacterium]
MVEDHSGHKPDGKVHGVQRVDKVKPGKVKGIDSVSYNEMQDAMDYVEKRFAEHGLIPGKKPVVSQTKKGETEQAAKQKVFKDQFKSADNTSRFLNATGRRIATSRAYQAFTLVGTDFVVRDLRYGIPADIEEQLQKKAKAEKMYDDKVAKAKVDRGEPAKEESIEEMATLKNVYADRSNLSGASNSKGKARSGLRKMLTAFEKLLVARFEKGIQIIKKLVGKNPIFNKKTEKQWKHFFRRFRSRTINKKIPAGEIKKFIFRALIELPKDKKGKLLVADMVHKSGKVEKFVRFNLQLQLEESLNKFEKLDPGGFFEMDEISDEIEGNIIYKAITYGGEMEKIKYGKLPQRGKFMTDVVEREVADRLGITIDRPKKKQ